MKQEDKELLLRDLSARLPYGILVEIRLPNYETKSFDSQIGELKELTKNGGYLVNSKGIDYRSFRLDIKPYLRPMSSMTEEEEKEFSNIKLSYHFDEDSFVLFDWLNARHFDYRGLIEKGLAIEAPKNMYK